MVRQRVPDWLNSSLWYSPPPTTDDRLLSSSTTSSSAPVVTSTSVIDPPLPVPPPAIVSNEPLKPELSIADSSNGSASDDSFNGDGGGPTSEDISRHAQISAELSRKVINTSELRRIASQGISDGAGIRSTVWKLLLGYLPADRGLWSSEMAKKRSQYKHFKEELLMNPSKITRKFDKSSIYDNDELNGEGSGELPRSEITHGEHPLSLGKTSIWNKFFQDTEIIEQIDRDVKRTHPDMHFFCGDSSFAKSNQETLKSILVVFAKLNPGIRYVQGMNEILAPLYYVFKKDHDDENAINVSELKVRPLKTSGQSLLCFIKSCDSLWSQACAEADTFFCFVELLSGLRDNFCQQLDNSVVGIRSTISRLSQLLKEHDEELWRHLEVTTKVNPQFYAFRWITLLLTQEFNFADILHIWDTLLSDPEGPQETLLRICCAMLILVRRRLLAGDFTSNLKLLQNYPPTNISHLLYVANKLRTQFSH